MKNSTKTLAENMRRFRTKNLSETTTLSSLHEFVLPKDGTSVRLNFGLDDKTAKLYTDPAQTDLLYTVKFNAPYNDLEIWRDTNGAIKTQIWIKMYIIGVQEKAVNYGLTSYVWRGEAPDQLADADNVFYNSALTSVIANKVSAWFDANPITSPQIVVKPAISQTDFK